MTAWQICLDPATTDGPRVVYGAWIESERADRQPAFFLADGLAGSELELRGAERPPRVGEFVLLRLLVENEPRVVALRGEVVRCSPANKRNRRRRFTVRLGGLDERCRAFLAALAEEADAEADARIAA